MGSQSRQCESLLLLQALISAARSASSPTVRRSFAQAAAAVAKTASEARTAKLVTDAVHLYSDPGVAHFCMVLSSANRGPMCDKQACW